MLFFKDTKYTQLEYKVHFKKWHLEEIRKQYSYVKYCIEHTLIFE